MRSNHFRYLKKINLRLRRLFALDNFNLLRELIRAKLKSSDFNSPLGFVWSLFGPLVMLAIMYAMFKDRFGASVKNYALYLLVGISTLNYFISATTYLLKSFESSREIVLCSTIPRENIMLADLFIHTCKFIVELTLCVVLSLFYASFTLRSFLLLLPLVAAYIAFVIGVSSMLAVAHAFNKDIEHIWSIFSRFVFFITPVFFTLDSISAFARRLVVYLNPFTPILLSFRSVLLEGGNVNWATYLQALFMGISIFGLGYILFHVFENLMIERI
ncbi:MAG: ABC transporter permease [Candidatus Omnitrophica bacterium]|nr:ABC transporter permease [Candidatus Omnitrophota bacterium]